MDVLYLIMLHIDGNIVKKFQTSILYRSRENHDPSNSWKNIKIAKNLLKSTPTTMDVLYLFMPHNDGNINKKFQTSIFYRDKKFMFPQ